MTISEIIKKYRIVLADKEHIRAEKAYIKGQSDIDLIKSKKPEILAVLLAEKEEEERKAAERQAKINAIEGLKELRSAINEIETWHDRFEDAWERGDGVIPDKPTVSVCDLRKKYPRADAFLLAESFEFSPNYEKSSAGEKAKERIINGEDFETVISEMKSEWNKAAMSHVWD